MTALFTLVKRNMKLYFGDRAQVFFSLLGAMLAIILVQLFLKSTLVDSVTAALGGTASRDDVSHLLDVWLIASAAVIASATTGLGALGQFVDDRETARWRDFLVTPLQRWTIVAGYLTAGAVVSLIMTTVVYGLGTAYCLALGAPLAPRDVLIGWSWLVLSSFGFTALMGFVVSLLGTRASFVGVSVIVGTAFGFLSGTYVTTGSLPTGVVRVLNTLPFAQASALVRAPYTSQVMATLPSQVRDVTAEKLGIELWIGQTAVTAPMTAAVLVAMAVVFSLGAWAVMTRTVRHG